MTLRLFMRHVVKLAVGPTIVLLAGTSLAGAEPTLAFQCDGQAVSLPPDDCKRIIQKIEAIVYSANYNSSDHPAGFEDLIDVRHIAEIRKDSFLRIHYSTPITVATIGGNLVADDIWIDIRRDRALPGPTCLANDGRFVAWLGKESGFLIVGLALDPSVYPHLPKQMQKDVEAGRGQYEKELRETAK